MNIAMRPEQNDDGEAIWNVNRAAFETDAEAHLVDALRQAGFVEISLVAQVDGEIVGHILFSRAFRGGSNIRHRSETAFEMVGIDGPRRGAADEP